MRMSWLIFLGMLSACGGSGGGGSVPSGSMGAIVSSAAPQASSEQSPTQLLLEGIAQMTADDCSGPYTVQSLDSKGSNALNVLSDTTIVPIDAINTTFFSDKNCSSSTPNLILLKGTSSHSFYLKSTKVGTFSLKVQAAGLTLKAPFSIDISAGAAKKLLLQGGKESIKAGDCEGPYSVIVMDQYDNILSLSQDIIIVGGSAIFYSDAACTNSTSVLSPQNNSFYLKNLAANLFTLTASKEGLQSAQRSIASVAADAAKLLVSGSQSIRAGECSAYTLSSVDSNSNPSTVSQETPIQLSQGVFLSQDDCNNGVNISSTVTLALGKDSMALYFKPTLAQPTELKASAAGFVDGTVTMDVQPDVVSQFMVMASYVMAGVCKEYKIIAKDQYGNPSSVSVDGIHIALNRDHIGSGKLYGASDSTCSGDTITGFNILVREKEKSFYFKDTRAEWSTFVVQANGFSDISSTVLVMPEAPSWLELSGLPQIVAGNCSPYIIKSKDTYGNLSKVSQDVSLNLLSNSSNVTFYSDGSCTSDPILNSTITIPKDHDTITVYVKDTQVEEVYLKISDKAQQLTAATLTVPIVAASPQNISFTGGTTVLTAGRCGSYTLSIKDEHGNLSPLQQAYISLNGGGGQALFYSDLSACEQSQTPINFLAFNNESQKTFYLKDLKAETFLLNSYYSALSASLSVTVNPDVPTRLLIDYGPTNTASSLGAGNCQPYHVTLKDQNGNDTTSSTSYVLSLSVDPEDSASFSSLSDCSENLPLDTSSDSSVKWYSITIPQGQSMTPFFFKPTKAAILTVKAQVRNIFPEQSFSIAVNPRWPSTISVTGAKTTFSTNQCTKFTATFKDEYLNPTSYYQSSSVGFQSFESNGMFYNDLNCSSSYPVSLSSPGGPSSIDFYFKSTQAGSTTLQVSANIGTNRTFLTGQLPVSIQVPVYVITAGGGHSCTIKEGAAWCWGFNGYGQLGNGMQDGSPHPNPISVSDLTSGVTAISAGGSYRTCAIQNGAAKCWGDNSGGQLGNQTIGVPQLTPFPVFGLESGVTAISAGENHTCAIHNGAAKCWGKNNYGQVGDGTMGGIRLTPVQVAGLNSGVTAISVGGYHACAIHNGAAKCWGRNDNGQTITNQLGYSAGYMSLTPTAVSQQYSGLTSGVAVQAISAGNYHTCAIQNGAAKCWGMNNVGQVSWAYNYSAGVAAISAGNQHTCLMSNGAAKCYGYSANGRLGNNFGSFGAPAISAGAQAISAGDSHTCAIQNDVAKCWGMNSIGQLGDGTQIERSTPVSVVFP